MSVRDVSSLAYFSSRWKTQHSDVPYVPFSPFFLGLLHLSFLAREKYRVPLRYFSHFRASLPRYIGSGRDVKELKLVKGSLSAAVIISHTSVMQEESNFTLTAIQLSLWVIEWDKTININARYILHDKNVKVPT